MAPTSGQCAHGRTGAERACSEFVSNNLNIEISKVLDLAVWFW